jgi:hypothetical protein
MTLNTIKPNQNQSRIRPFISNDWHNVNISQRLICISIWTQEYPEKTTNLSQVTDKLYYIMLYTSPWLILELTTSMVIGTDCIGSCKSNSHAITVLNVAYKIKRITVIVTISSYSIRTFRSRILHWYDVHVLK